MTDTTAEAEKAVLTERGVPAWVAELMAAEEEPEYTAVYRRRMGDTDVEGSEGAALPSYVVEHELTTPDTEHTYMDARWALEKDSYLAGQAYTESLIERPLESGQEFGDYAAYAAWRLSRVHRLKAYARKQGERGRAALRATTVGAGYAKALDALNAASRTVRARRARNIAIIVRRPGREVNGNKVLDWHLLYLTTAQHDEVQAAIAYERSRLQLAFRNRE